MQSVDLVLGGLQYRQSLHMPEGQIFRFRNVAFAAPLTYWSLQHEGRYPLLSRFSPGMIALERDRRRR